MKVLNMAAVIHLFELENIRQSGALAVTAGRLRDCLGWV